jgi:surface antigen
MRGAAVLVAAALGSGCASGGLLSKAEADPTVLTNSVGSVRQAADAETASDQATIRNAVSSANLEEMAGGLAWANPGTGSRGTISDVREYRESGVLCRRFTGSRESFRGIALVTGDTCLGSDGAWWVRAFAES